jgi:hypothetical protein
MVNIAATTGWHHLVFHYVDFNNDSLVTSAKCTHKEKGEFLPAIYDAGPNGWE